MNKILQVSLIVVSVLVVMALGAGLFFAGSAFAASQQQAQTVPGTAPNLNNAPNGNQNNGGQNGLQNNDQNSVNPPNQDPKNGGNQSGPNGGQNGGPNDGPNGQGRPTGQGNNPGGPDQRGNGPNDGRGPRQGNGNGNGPNGGNQADLTPPTEDEARQAAEDYIASLNLDGLEVGQVLIVDTHAYVVVQESATGIGAFDLAVDPVKKEAHPAPGPSTQWNLKYGGVLQANMPDRMGRPGPKGPNTDATATPAPDTSTTPAATPANVSADMPISQEEAIQAAQTFLTTNDPDATVDTTVYNFYGYYTVTFSKDGQLAGILSVNGYNGQVAGRPGHGDMPDKPQS